MSYMSGIPKATPRFCDFTTGTHKPQHIVVLTAKIYYSAGIQIKSAKGNGAWSKVQRKSGTSFQKSSPGGVTQDVLKSSSSEL